MDILTLDDAVEHVRSKPDMYLGGGARPDVIAQAIVGDALVLGAGRVLVLRHGPWWAVAADADWLTAPCRFPSLPPECFRRIVPFPEAGVNCMRHEILATAFARAVVSCTPERREVISGAELADATVCEHLLPAGFARSLAFMWSAS